MEWFGVLVVYSLLAAMMVLVAFVLFYWFNTAAEESREKARSQAAALGTATAKRMHR